MIKVKYSIYASDLMSAYETHSITQTIQNLTEIKNQYGKEHYLLDLSVKFYLQIDDNPEIGEWKFSIENAISFLIKLKNKKNIKSGNFKKIGNHIAYEEG